MNKCSSAQIFKLRFHACPREVTMKKSKDVAEVVILPNINDGFYNHILKKSTDGEGVC